MVSITIEMDWVLLNINDGLEKLGWARSPRRLGVRRGGRHRLSSVNQGPNGNLNPLLFWVLRRGLLGLDPSSPFTSSVVPETLPKVDLVLAAISGDVWLVGPPPAMPKGTDEPVD